MCVSWGRAGSSPRRERESAKCNYRAEPGSLAGHLLPGGKNLAQRRRPQVSQLCAHLKWCLLRGAPRCPSALGSGEGLSAAVGPAAWARAPGHCWAGNLPSQAPPFSFFGRRMRCPSVSCCRAACVSVLPAACPPCAITSCRSSPAPARASTSTGRSAPVPCA